MTDASHTKTLGRVVAFAALLLAPLVAHAQGALPPAGAQWELAPGVTPVAPDPSALVLGPDGRVRHVPLRQLSSSARRTLRADPPLREEQGGSDARVGPTVTTTTAGNANATAEIVVNYTGFNGLPEAREAFQRAVDIWARHLQSPITIAVDARFVEFGEDLVLGSAGPTVFQGLEAESGEITFFVDALADVLLGRDIEEDRDEVIARFNRDFDWYYGADPDGSGPNQFDFTTVVLHELGHGLGFLGSMDVEDAMGSYGLRDGNGDIVRDDEGNAIPIIYDRFAEDVSGEALLDNDRYPNPSATLADTLTGGGAGSIPESTVRFNGPEARLGAPVNGEEGSARPRLFTPSEWDVGSSYSHLDEDEYPGDTGDPDALMTPFFARREVSRGPGGITCGMFADMGWPLGGGCLAAVGIQVSDLNIEPGGTGIIDDGERVRLQFSTSEPARVDRFVVSRCFGTASACATGAGGAAFRRVEIVPARADQQSYTVAVGVPTPGTYTFRVRQIDTSSLESSQDIGVRMAPAEGFTVSEAFPNPFQSRTEVRVLGGDRAGSSVVTATLYDARGRRVRTLLDGERIDGQRVLALSAGSLASGVYYLRIEGEDFSETRSVVLVR